MEINLTKMLLVISLMNNITMLSNTRVIRVKSDKYDCMTKLPNVVMELYLQFTVLCYEL